MLKNFESISACVIVIFQIYLVHVQSQDLTAGQNQIEFCKNNSHYVIDDYTCCRFNSYPAGFPFSKFWKECSKSSENVSESLTTSMWRIYTCMTEKRLDGKTLDLKIFSQMMVSNYPQDIKDEILAKIDQNQDFSQIMEEKLGNEFQNIYRIRQVYYRAEMEVCNNGIISESQSVEDQQQKCNAIIETGNKRGDCCENISIPIIPDYTPNIVVEAEMSQCLSQLMDSLGDYKKDINITNSFVQNQCSLTCVLMKIGIISSSKGEKPESFEFYTKSLFEHLIPRHFSQTVKSYIKDYVITGLRADERSLFKRADKNFAFVKKEFNSFKSEFKARELYTSCEFHNMFAILVETAVYSICDGEMKFSPFGGEKILI